MPETPKKKPDPEEPGPEEGECGTWAEDQKKHDYYYDDSHGYEVFDPEAEDEEE